MDIFFKNPVVYHILIILLLYKVELADYYYYSTVTQTTQVRNFSARWRTRSLDGLASEAKYLVYLNVKDSQKYHFLQMG
jgi:hypothetical protein